MRETGGGAAARMTAMDDLGLDLRPLAGGYSGETFTAGDGDAAVVVRLYARQPTRMAVDAALLRLLRGVIPVPEVLETRLPADGQPGLLVTARLPGTRLDLVLPTADAALTARIGRGLGELLARLSGIPMPGFGGLDDELRVDPGALPPGDLADWARHHRDTGRLASWAAPDWAALEELVDLAGDLEDSEPPRLRRHVLVHGDLNPKNLLVDETTGEVTGLVDWEYAHAGSPYTDLGNLTRFERQPALLAAAAEAMTALAPPLGTDPLLRGRAADLWSLIELAGSAPRGPVADLAAELLLAQARARDLMAWPWAGGRRDPG